MFDKLTNEDDRGQVGIGTLIVFIAMVLVAAIAAGVLINTAGFLQSSAEETGQQSSDQVTNRVEVVNTVGTNINNDAVDTVQITVKKAPGAGNIDLGSTILQFVHSSGATDLTADTANSGSNADITSTSSPSSKFIVSTVQDDGSSIGNSQVLDDPADRAKIHIDAAAIIDTDGGTGLEEGETATIQINTQSGGTTEVRLVVPETLSGNSAVTL